MKLGYKPSRNQVVCKVSTFNARRLKSSDFIDIRGNTRAVLLNFEQVNVTAPNHFSFKNADPAYTRPDARIRGFLYYHTSYPRQFLSGGLRFRCTDHPANAPLVAFECGHDLMNKYLLRWQLPLSNLIAKVRYKPLLKQLVLDGLLTGEKIRTATKLFVYNPSSATIPPAFIHDLEQPFLLDLSRPAHICVLGPHAVMRTEIYPAVAQSGSAIVRFERTVNEEELCIRVLGLYDPVWYLPEYRHLPPLVPEALLPSPLAPLPWTWNHDNAVNMKHGVALHCLFHPSHHFPQE
ncbi:hypothetical protein C8R44DRAFT_886677 [Mycena epipterygia]|nr:hypothetical protein C8R44DRAFT_886677 [Mycena epipterygia]